uniref:Uncharacterized protein n=1 Tax=Panagrolaimus sp. PS1159 TaxID=55785 RepID=A0AC35FIQ0_9BILA
MTTSYQPKNKVLLLRPFFLAIYLFALVFAVPLSLFVWFIRRVFFDEKSVAGDNKSCSLSSSIQSNGMEGPTDALLG